MSALRKSLCRSARSIPSSSRAVALPRQAALQQLRPSEAIFRRWNSSATHNPAIEAPLPGAKPQKIAQLEPRLQMTFTCTADGCGHRSTHEFAKKSYEKGIVLVQCPECKNRHLIADHLGWFKESLEGGKLKTVEDLLRAKGEKVKKGRVNFDGDIEIDGE